MSGLPRSWSTTSTDVGEYPRAQRDRVRAGYNALSRTYRGDTADKATQRRYAEWLSLVRDRAPAGGDVLDLGCGNGIPAAKWLSDSGFRVTGVDLSDTMVERARDLVPAATFLRGDMALAEEVDFGTSTFHAVVSLYALIHVPIHDQPGVIERIAGWLRPGGLLVATVGHTAWTGTESDWLGGGAPMSWSHPGAATYRAWLESAGLAIDDERFVPEGTSGHTLFVATRAR
jgi:2-polyprenyl-3-methyl-5-hydroxy-6-metoxy-1,4-benzoquinol methylase